jgi:alpha-D-ribose 1-methylphosphonate 5-triphosphate synthase subunit PhnH
MMRIAWRWFNRISTVVGLTLMLAEGCAWSWSSIRAGHVISLLRFHQQFEQYLFQLIDPAFASPNSSGPTPSMAQRKSGQ